eukprot:2440989-Karenia_brevis.AAC.1
MGTTCAEPEAKVNMEDTFTSQLTGISRGKFADLRIKRAGSFQEINAVLDGMASSTDLSDYYTQTQTNTLLAGKVDSTYLADALT